MIICFSFLKLIKDRETGIGQIISKYLKMENSMSNETIHLLFSANRWEHMLYI
ncbi:hypothetical protein PFNF135_04349 [Plasmodium falciparum NF135/5.C10]|uniref:Uncharacterized protein n=1 Tax=Plasmodium falciparum NF135/5.C10 TaxID=1036726 RepID=W4IE99_PLAFA|nr:hypothetical protein PFNF135_04349 [Plasmodium falciparum NF135/5.C10]